MQSSGKTLHLFSLGRDAYTSKALSRASMFPSASGSLLGFPLACVDFAQMMSIKKHHFEVLASRRRRGHMKSETYVLLEPGKNEEFISEGELKIRLKGWLENWPEQELPPDLARFETIDDAVSHLVRSVCELELDGEVGSVQWYQVQLE